MKLAILAAMCLLAAWVNPKIPPSKTTVGREAISFHVTGLAGKPGQTPNDLKETSRAKLE